MSTPPFPEAAIGPTIFAVLGFLLATTIILTVYVWKLRTKIENNNSKEFKPDINQLKVGNSTKKILEEVVQHPQLQSDLPELTNVSKATVSQSIKELKNQGYIKRKKRGNTYLIEPKMETLEEECGR